MTLFLIFLLIVFYFAQTRSKDTALDGLEFDYRPSKVLLEPGEEFELILTVTNKSYRFVPFLKTEELIPKQVACLTEGAFIREDIIENSRHVSSLYMMPKSKLVRKITLSIEKRGRYVFRGIEVYGGDFLGLNESRKYFSFYNEVVVYPKLIDAPDILAVLGGFMGDISVRRFIIEDPVLTAGIREYTGKEPMKSISWSHSARMGNLMVKQFDYTIEPAITVLVDVENDSEEGSGEIIEKVFNMARTVCQTLEEKGMKYDVLTNATVSDGFARWSYLNEGIGKIHFATVLSGLGRATYNYVERFALLIDTLCKDKEYSRSTVIISIKNDAYRAENIRYLEMKTGGRVYCLFGEAE